MSTRRLMKALGIGALVVMTGTGVRADEPAVDDSQPSGVDVTVPLPDGTETPLPPEPANTPPRDGLLTDAEALGITPERITAIRTENNMGWGEIDHSLALANKLVLDSAALPTPMTGDAALTQILELRASGMGWGQIAQSLGTTMGELKRPAHAGPPAPPVEEPPTDVTGTDVDVPRNAQPKHMGRPEGVGRPDNATRPESVGRPVNRGKPDAAGRPEGKGKPDNTGKPEGKGKPDKPGQNR